MSDNGQKVFVIGQHPGWEQDILLQFFCAAKQMIVIYSKKGFKRPFLINKLLFRIIYFHYIIV
jgi:hypothetical protein